MAQLERKLREVFPRTPPPPPTPHPPPIYPELPETRPPSYNQSMAEGGGIPGDGITGEEWSNFDEFDAENWLVNPDLSLYNQPLNLVKEGNRQEMTPATVTDTPVTVNPEPTPQTVTTNQALENQENSATFTSNFAKQLAQEEEGRRLSSLPVTNLQVRNTNETSDRIPAMSRIKPFTTDERNWFKDIFNTVGEYADEQEMRGEGHLKIEVLLVLRVKGMILYLLTFFYLKPLEKSMEYPLTIFYLRNTILLKVEFQVPSLNLQVFYLN